MSSLGSTPDLRAAEMALQVASDCEGQPPALPRFAKTSQRPCSSWFTVTNNVPQPMRNLNVLPAVTRVRGLGLPARSWRPSSLPEAFENVCPCREPSR